MKDLPSTSQQDGCSAVGFDSHKYSIERKKSKSTYYNVWFCLCQV